MDYRLIYEHFICKAFSCQKADYHFAKADCYDFASKHLSETFAYIECAIIVFIKEGICREELNTILKDISDKRFEGKLNTQFLDAVLSKISNTLKIY